VIWIAAVIAIFLVLAFPKQAVILIGLAVALVLILLSGLYIMDRFEKRQQSLIEVTVVFDPAGYSSQYPLRVTIKNNSSKLVEKVDWQFAAFSPGHSTNLIDGYASMSTDKILASGESTTLFYRVPKLKAEELKAAMLDWSISYKRAVFREN